jgi:folylpolyglutamate synthase/dihydrofolate synthase
MRFERLKDWLDWQVTLHPAEIDLGLERVAGVLDRMGRGRPPFTVISVTGTNGKGSCVAMLEAVLSAAGYRVGSYTSPHLLRYNERIRVLNREVDDERLCQAFQRVDDARMGVTLTYFEFGTLAALDIFYDVALDVVLLEVGLGGRLDAVNVLDADVALVTSVGVDHVEWLGADRESIGREKAGILRTGRPAVCGDPDPPHSLIRHAQHLGADLYCLGRDFHYASENQCWHWYGPERLWNTLVPPNLGGDHQLQNAAAVLMVLDHIAARFPVGHEDICRGLRAISLPGRLQVMPGPPECILDVAHNPDSAQALARALKQRECSGRTLAVFSLLANKDLEGIVSAMNKVVDIWYPAGLTGTRGLTAGVIASRLRAFGVRGSVVACTSVQEACAYALKAARAGDRVLIFGSFRTVEAALKAGIGGY